MVANIFALDANTPVRSNSPSLPTMSGSGRRRGALSEAPHRVLTLPEFDWIVGCMRQWKGEVRPLPALPGSTALWPSKRSANLDVGLDFHPLRRSAPTHVPAPLLGPSHPPPAQRRVTWLTSRSVGHPPQHAEGKSALHRPIAARQKGGGSSEHRPLFLLTCLKGRRRKPAVRRESVNGAAAPRVSPGPRQWQHLS